MPEQRLKSRIVHKHDTEANWLKAENFSPMQGEIIVYDIEVDKDGNTLPLPEGRTAPYTYERFKIGDGITNVIDLPFVVPTKVSQLENDRGYLTEIPSEYITETELNNKRYLTSYTETDPTVPAWAKAANKPSYNLGEISDTTSYVRMTPAERTKLSGIATGAEVNVQSDWNVTDTSSDAYIKNKPTLGSLAAKSVVNKTDLASSVQTSLGKADTALQSFTETDPTVPSHVKAITEDDISSWNAKSEFSGSYNDLTNKPTIPSAYTHPSSHPASMITGLATVATSGKYSDLSGTPTIPTVNNATLTIQKNGTTVKTFTANSATDVTANITVPTKVSELTNDSGFKTTDNNTTYDLAASTSSSNGNVKLNLTAGGSGSGTDSVTIKGSGATTVTTDANGVVTISSTDNNTVYTHPNSGVTAGTYKSVTVDAQGHVTGGSNPTTLAGYGITDGESKGTASTAVSTHNTSTSAHNDIRDLISGLTTRLNTLANSTDEDLDQLAEIVAYIKANKGLIDGITTSKVNVADIVNNLTTNVSTKPLSAAQGVVVKGLIDDLQSALNTHATNTTVHITATERTNWNTAKTKIDALGISYDSSSNTVTFS